MLLLEALASEPEGQRLVVALQLQEVLEQLEALGILQQGVQAPGPLQAGKRRRGRLASSSALLLVVHAGSQVAATLRLEAQGRACSIAGRRTTGLLMGIGTRRVAPASTWVTCSFLACFCFFLVETDFVSGAVEFLGQLSDVKGHGLDLFTQI